MKVNFEINESKAKSKGVFPFNEETLDIMRGGIPDEWENRQPAALGVSLGVLGAVAIVTPKGGQVRNWEGPKNTLRQIKDWALDFRIRRMFFERTDERDPHRWFENGTDTCGNLGFWYGVAAVCGILQPPTKSLPFYKRIPFWEKGTVRMTDAERAQHRIDVAARLFTDDPDDPNYPEWETGFNPGRLDGMKKRGMGESVVEDDFVRYPGETLRQRQEYILERKATALLVALSAWEDLGGTYREV